MQANTAKVARLQGCARAKRLHPCILDALGVIQTT